MIGGRLSSLRGYVESRRHVSAPGPRATRRGATRRDDYRGSLALTCVVFLVLAPQSALAASGIQRATFNVLGTSKVSISGTANGVLNPGLASASVLQDAPLDAQSFQNSLQVGYSGTINADVSFDISTRAVTNIRFTGANLVAGNSGNWRPGNWNGTGFPSNGTATQAGNYGTNISGLINGALRSLALDLNSGTTVYPVAGGTFTANAGNFLQFTAGNFDLYSTFNSGGLFNRHDTVTNYRGYEVDPLAVQPLLDSLGHPNPNGGLPYPGGVVWRYVTGTGPGGQRLYGDLAPAFDITKGGIDPGHVDTAWYQPDDGTVGKPDAVRLYDGGGAQSPLAWQNASGNPSLLASAYNGPITNNFNVQVDLNFDAPVSIVTGNFVFNVNFGQALDAFGTPIPGTGTVQASKTLNLLPGDTNFDGVVNLVDVQVVGLSWQQTGPAGLFLPSLTNPNFTADTNGDGVVNLVDVQVIGLNWMASAGGAGTAVPEPAALLLAALGGLLALAVRRRRRVR